MKSTLDIRFIAVLTLALIAIGAVYIFPDIYFIREAGEKYKGIGPIGFRDETLYLGRINAFYDNKGLYGNQAIYEHSGDLPIMPPLSEFLEHAFGQIFGMNVERLDMAATLILPIAIFLLTVFFSLKLSGGSKYGAIIAGLTVIFGMHFFSRAFMFSGRIISNSYNLPLWFTRPITPQMHFIFFIPALIFIWKNIEEDRVVYLLLGGLSLGALFYVSVFYWVYAYALIGCMMIVQFFKKDIKSAGNLLTIALLALIFAMPYWILNLKTMSHPEYALLLQRFNIAYTHKMIFPVLSLIVFASLLFTRKDIIRSAGEKAFYFLASMLVAVMLTLNQQILTGKLFKESHWTTYTGKFAILTVLVISLSALLKKIYDNKQSFRPFIKLSVIVFTAALFIHAVSVQINYSRTHFAGNLRSQEKAGALNWIRGNCSSEDVILPSPNDVELSELVPIYTKSYVYYSEPFFCLSLIPEDETSYRMAASYRLFGLTQEEAMRHPYAWDGAIFLTGDTNRPAGFTEDKRRRFNELYSRFASADGLTISKRYKVDYILASNESDRRTINELTAKGLELVYDDGKFSVIKAGGK